MVVGGGGGGGVGGGGCLDGRGLFHHLLYLIL